ncbi:MAG: FprA family A-type flavoprotein [Candidatus Omnitrophota bacterium]
MMIKKDIYWTGYIDWALRNFHGYSTPSGSTYNAYLLLDEKPTLIDTVKRYGYEEMLYNIREVIDPSKIRYIISNHTEMDHSGSIGKMLEHCPGAEVVCSAKGEEGLKKHFGSDWKFKVVTTGDSISIGKRTLKFFPVPMVHWPDSMVTYCPQEKILFSNDAFGQHHASSERFADEVGIETVCKEAEKYYANIVLPYGSQVVKALEALQSLPIETICPSHGLVWRRAEDIKRIIALYTQWAQYQSEPRVAIVYDTMWHSSEKMALRLCQLLEKDGLAVKLMSLQAVHISDAMTEVMRSRVICIGSAILNNKILPSMGAFLTYMKGLKPKNRSGFTFGSYGWSQIGFKELEDALHESGITKLCDSVYSNWVPDEGELKRLEEVVIKIKQAIL